MLITITSFSTCAQLQQCLFRLSLPCVCDTPVQQCWSAGWRSAATSPCRCESGRCELPRWAPHPPPRTWNTTTRVYFPFTALGRSKQCADRRWTQILTGSWGSASSLFRCKGRWRWWAGDPAGRWGCREGSDSLCRGYWEIKRVDIKCYMFNIQSYKLIYLTTSLIIVIVSYIKIFEKKCQRFEEWLLIQSILKKLKFPPKWYQKKM